MLGKRVYVLFECHCVLRVCVCWVSVCLFFVNVNEDYKNVVLVFVCM